MLTAVGQVSPAWRTAGRIDAVARHQRGDLLQVGGGKAQLLPTFLARLDHAGHAKGPAQQRACQGHVSGQQFVAHPAAGDLLVLLVRRCAGGQLQRRHQHNGHAFFLAERLQRGHRSLTIAAETEVETLDDGPGARPMQTICSKNSRADNRKRGIVVSMTTT